MMWRNETCIFIGFFSLYADEDDSAQYSEESLQFNLSGSVEDLAMELVTFINNEFPDIEKDQLYRLFEYFWKKKNTDRIPLSPEILIKIEEVEKRARKIIEDAAIPSVIRDTPMEDLAKELATYIDNEFPEIEKNQLYRLFKCFWEKKNIHRIPLTPEIRIKKDEVERRARDIIDDAAIPSEISDTSPEDLAEKLVEFAKSQTPSKGKIWIPNIARRFWETRMGYQNIGSSEIQEKMCVVENLAQNLIEQEREMRKKKEVSELPSNTNNCVTWAKNHGLRRITVSDLQVFLSDSGLELLTESQKMLQAQVNLKLKEA